MLCEAELIAKRATLHWLVHQHPEWTQQDLADALKMSHCLREQMVPAAAPDRSY